MINAGSISPEAVNEQLRRILASAGFQSTQQLSGFLRFVVEETLAGRSNQLKAYTIAVNVLGRKDSYDPQTDATVRILAGRLRARLDQYYSESGGRDLIRILIPKGCYVPVFQMQKPAAYQDLCGTTEHRDSSESDQPSVAVLPLTNLNGHPEDDYFAIGLTEQLILTLGNYQGLLVLPRYATMSFKGRPEDVNRIGQALGARFVLEGSVRKVGPTMRVNVYLNDAIAGRQVWAQAYEHELSVENLLAVQVEIARNVAITIGDLYGGVIPRVMGHESREKPITPSLTAYKASLHYIHFFSELCLRTYVETREAIEAALSAEPDNPELLAMISTVRRVGYGLGFSAEDNPLAEILPQARLAVYIDPLSQLARANLVGAYQLARDPQGMIRESEALLSLKPYGIFWGVAGWSLALAGEWERGLKILGEQMDALRYYPGWFHFAGFMDHYRRGDYEGALREAHMTNTPTVLLDPLQRAAAFAQLGMRNHAKWAIAELLELCPAFFAAPRRYLNWLVPSDDLVDHLLQGVEKAGIALS